MKALGIAGWSGSGKTTLVLKLIPALRQRGVSVSTVKHAHHNFDVDKPGKDSWEHRQAGAREVLVAMSKKPYSLPWAKSSTANIFSTYSPALVKSALKPVAAARG